jgi:hypothetical protein
MVKSNVESNSKHFGHTDNKNLEYSFYFQSFEVKLIKCALCIASLAIASVSLRNSCRTLMKRTSGRTSAAYKILIFSASLLWWCLVLLTNVYSTGKAFLVRPDHPGYDNFNIVFLTILKVSSILCVYISSDSV